MGHVRANGTTILVARSWGSSRRNREKRTLASAESAMRGIAGITGWLVELLLVAGGVGKVFLILGHERMIRACRLGRKK